MGLNVQWRWATPQVGNPDQVAQGNRDSFNEGLGALVQGLLKKRENQREEQKLLQAQKNWQAQFDQAKTLQDFNMQRQKNMMDFIKSRYGHMLGIGDDDPVKQEYDRLLAELKEQQRSNQAQMIMMGLNPQFMR